MKASPEFSPRFVPLALKWRRVGQTLETREWGVATAFGPLLMGSPFAAAIIGVLLWEFCQSGRLRNPFSIEIIAFGIAAAVCAGIAAFRIASGRTVVYDLDAESFSIVHYSPIRRRTQAPVSTARLCVCPVSPTFGNHLSRSVPWRGFALLLTTRTDSIALCADKELQVVREYVSNSLPQELRGQVQEEPREAVAAARRW